MKAILSTNMILEIQKHINDGWSFDYASSLVGVNRGLQNYLMKNSEQYRQLNAEYQKIKKAEKEKRKYERETKK